jgi:hypothetical protein
MDTIIIASKLFLQISTIWFLIPSLYKAFSQSLHQQSKLQEFKNNTKRNMLKHKYNAKT